MKADRSPQPLAKAAFFVFGAVVALVAVGCAQRPVQAQRGDLVTYAIDVKQFKQALAARQGLCFRTATFCIPPIQVPDWQAPLLGREAVLKVPAATPIDTLPLSKVCELSYGPMREGTVTATETCVLLYR
jgi:hypothetical protein